MPYTDLPKKTKPVLSSCVDYEYYKYRSLGADMFNEREGEHKENRRKQATDPF